MSKQAFKPSLQLVLAHEGGFVNHPSDPGGATYKGVTQAVYNTYRKLAGLPQRSVRYAEDWEIEAIYRKSYWDKVEGDRLPAGVDYAIFDYGVNSGVSKAVKDIQRVLNANANYFGLSGQLKVDGIAGDATVDAVCTAVNIDEVELIQKYCNFRMAFLKTLKTFKTFGKGWTRRVLGDIADEAANDNDHGVIDYAVMMARKDLAFPIPKAQLPAAIGEKVDEIPGKAIVADQKTTATRGGVGAIVAGVGVSGNTVIAAADQVKSRIDDTWFGKLALGAFAILMIVGVGLLIWDFIRKTKEKSSNA